MMRIVDKTVSEPSPIKDILYEQINSISERKIQEEISKNNTAGIISKVMDVCGPKIDAVGGNKHLNFEAFAESLMHYLLTNALIQSQRKVTHNSAELDIVIPDLRTLVSSPKDALVIFFPKTDDTDKIRESLGKIESVQPIKENIWLVQKTSLGLDHRTYEVNKRHSFSNIVNDINAFLSSKTQSKFKIFKV